MYDHELDSYGWSPRPLQEPREPGPTTTGELALTVIGPRTEIVAVALRSPASSMPAEESCAVRLLTSPSAWLGSGHAEVAGRALPGRQREARACARDGRRSTRTGT